MSMRIIRLLVLLIATCVNATVFASETIAVIIGINSPLEKLSLSTLKRVYLRKSLVDEKGKRWVPLNLNINDPLRQDFSLALFAQLPEEQNDYWNNQYFHGINPPKVMASEEAVLRFVAATAGAIGYVRLSKVNEHVKILQLINPPEK